MEWELTCFQPFYGPETAETVRLLATEWESGVKIEFCGQAVEKGTQHLAFSCIYYV